jgi:CBS domain-containing protein
MKVSDVMTTAVTTTRPEAPLKDAALDLARNGISGMPVLAEGGFVVGVISEADILVKEGEPHGSSSGFLRWLIDPDGQWLGARFEASTVGEAMSAPALTIAPDRPLAEAATTMIEERVNRLPVVGADGALVGLVSRGDLVRAFTRTDAEILREIEADVVGKALWIEDTGLNVAVTDGVVTLSGVVATHADAELLPKFVRRVPGVVSVTSTLKTSEDRDR